MWFRVIFYTNSNHFVTAKNTYQLEVALLGHSRRLDVK